MQMVLAGMARADGDGELVDLDEKEGTGCLLRKVTCSLTKAHSRD